VFGRIAAVDFDLENSCTQMGNAVASGCRFTGEWFQQTQTSMNNSSPSCMTTVDQESNPTR
jgi:hypothetical protein